MGGDIEIFVREKRKWENSQMTLFFTLGSFSQVNKVHSSFCGALGGGRQVGASV